MAVRKNSDELIQPTGTPWVWAAFALPFTVPLWFVAVRSDTAGETVTAVSLAVVYVGTYGWTIFRSVTVRVIGCALVTALTAVFTAVYGNDPMYFSFPLALLAIVLPWHLAATSSIGLTVAVIVADTVLSGDGVDRKLMLLLVVVISALGIGGFWRLNQQLRAANAAIALMAVRDDRERMARDLHDVLGSNLTTIAVKAGLARKLIRHDAGDDAVREVEDIESLSRQALGDVRSAVTAGYTMQLGPALAKTLAALKAAGVASEVSGSPEEVAVALRETFAYVLHEAVTNVLRHSRASRCWISFEPTVLEIRDNGTGAVAGSGNGLAGIAERLAHVGGSHTYGPVAEGGFRVSVSGPAQ